LNREIERDLDPELLRVRHELAELLLSSQGRLDGVVAALRRGYRPRAPDGATLSLLGVVPALAVRYADGVDRRQVEHVEAELSEARQKLADAGEAAPGAREELVPRAEAGEGPVDVDLVRGRPCLLGPLACRRRERVLDRQLLRAEQHRSLRQLAGELRLARR